MTWDALKKARVSNRPKGELNFISFDVKWHIWLNVPDLDTNDLKWYILKILYLVADTRKP